MGRIDRLDFYPICRNVFLTLSYLILILTENLRKEHIKYKTATATATAATTATATASAAGRTTATTTGDRFGYFGGHLLVY